MTTTTTAKISVGTQITGYTITIDRTDITLSHDEAILLTHLLLKKGAGINLADVVDPRVKDAIAATIEKLS